MSYRSIAEREINKKLSEKLNLRGGSFYRAWLDSGKYYHPVTFDPKIPLEPIKEIRVIYPIHSYEIFEMEPIELEECIDKICQHIQKISDYGPNCRFNYVEEQISISLEYRVASILFKYNIVSLTPTSQ